MVDLADGDTQATVVGMLHLLTTLVLALDNVLSTSTNHRETKAGL